jgi:solute carrier family 35 (UDP-sugar transporter), member A1/2/3
MMAKVITSTTSTGSSIGNKKRNTSSSNSNQLSYKALFFMALLSIQFGIQPIVTKRYTSPNIIKSTVIFMQEIAKLCLGIVGISLGNVSWTNVVDGKLVVGIDIERCFDWCISNMMHIMIFLSTNQIKSNS